MWFVMESAQTNYELSDRLIRAISNLRTFSTVNDDIEQLLESGADVNRLHGTLLPLQCACMVSDAYCLQLLLEKGALVCLQLCAVVYMELALKFNRLTIFLLLLFKGLSFPSSIRFSADKYLNSLFHIFYVCTW